VLRDGSQALLDLWNFRILKGSTSKLEVGERRRVSRMEKGSMKNLETG